MEHVRCLTIAGAGNVRYEDGYRVHQNWALGMACKAETGSWTNRPHVPPLLSSSKIRICQNVSMQRPARIYALANGAAEFGTLAEQDAVNSDASSTLLDGKTTPSGLAEVQSNTSSKTGNEKGPSLRGIFPGGLRRAEVRLPGLIMMVRAADVLGPVAKEFLDKMDSAVAGGFTMVVLESGRGTSGDESSSGAHLYEAARRIKALLRGRAELLIADRVDIAAAAGASGVLLSDEGLPAVVARSMMQNVSPDNPVLPLVARSVSSAESALLATASEGADLLILQGLREVDTKIVTDRVREGISIPIFSQDPGGLLKVDGESFPSLNMGVNGLIYNSSDLKNIPAEDVGGKVASVVSAMSAILQSRSARASTSSLSSDVQTQSSTSTPTDYATSKSLSLDLEFRAILEEERSLLASLIKLLKEASPEMEEVSLLTDAFAQLDEPFLLMVVGEFNSGKSSVINALLGKRYLPEGVLPTTNEIALLKYAGDGVNGKERSERHPDGHFMYYLPAEILKEINLVDTPGTNVILKRQQRLTEEFVPRADLVLFVLSADRPFTESEMAFLRYIMQWDKRVIFLLNKSDIFLDEKELEEVVKFVKDNARQLLSVEQATIYAVSARKAYQAKKEVGVDSGILDVKELVYNDSWNLSGFRDLEKFIADFLGGSSDAGAERRRLKLATPLGIALTLLEACDVQLSVEANNANADMEWLNGLLIQLDGYQKVLENNSTTQRQQLSALIDGAKVRAENFVDSVLRLSNIEAVASYVLGGDRQGKLPVAGGFESQVLGSVQNDVQKLLEEHGNELQENRSQQVTKYRDLVTMKWPNIEASERAPTNQFSHTGMRSKETSSVIVLDSFDVQAAKIVLEQELRDVVISTFGGLGAAGMSASVLTAILPTTLEDLAALAVCSAGGLVGVWNLPNRRADVKGKVSKVADTFANQLEAAMVAEVRETVNELKEEVRDLLQPYLEAAQAEVRRVRSLQDQISKANNQIQTLRRKVQNLGIS